MNISIIGSFQRYYDEICKLIHELKKSGHQIFSPSDSKIVSSIDQFVIFESDNKKLTPAEIQTETLNKILKSDIVYVYCKDGYIGRTTCYEIGVLRTTKIPLFFSERPKDIPIEISAQDIIPEELLSSFLRVKDVIKRSNELNVLTDRNIIQNGMKEKKIVICGSMAFYKEMDEIKSFLSDRGIPTIIPKEENSEVEAMNAETYMKFKRRVSMQYLSRIRESTTFAILVVNEEKHGIKNYIGSNTLAEIAMAFCWGRNIYLYNDCYKEIQDELNAWGAISLNKNFNRLIEDYNQNRYSFSNYSCNQNEIEGQLGMF